MDIREHFKVFEGEDLTQACVTYNNEYPFPYICIDNFWNNEEELMQASEEFYHIPNEEWDGSDQHDDMQLKRGYKNMHNMPLTLKKIIQVLESPEALSYFSRLTGIFGLQADPEMHGGGLHVTSRGGKLSVHSDFNIHPTSGLHRRLNILLYMNPVWESNWGGNIELWNYEMTEKIVDLEPVFNRMVLFNTTSETYHGHPDPLNTPEGIERRSIALYYYTAQRPEYEKREYHARALWQKRVGIDL